MVGAYLQGERIGSHETRPDDSSLSNRAHLRAIAVDAMRARGLDPDFPPDAIAQAGAAATRRRRHAERARRAICATLLWCSIDNDDSRDLDQLSVAEPHAGGDVRDPRRHRRRRRARAEGLADRPPRRASTRRRSTRRRAIFPMLPERLSTDLTSLNEDEDRLAVVIEMTVAPTAR